jgi:hypothetical protein
MQAPLLEWQADEMNPEIVRVLALTGLVLAACRSAGPDGAAPPASSPTPRALVGPRHLIPVISRDAIPSIDDPKFIPPEQAGWLADREPVVSMEIDGDARAYPVQIMTWHEVVNDVVAGMPVAVTFCPLCNSAVAYDRRVDGRTLEFGTSGMLYRSALVMYDRQTESLWSHFEGLAVRGPLTGTRLEFIPVQMLSFDQWRREYPDGRVLSRHTEVEREYGQNPYEFYDSNDAPLREFFIGGWDRRLPALARVVGVSLGETATAYPYRMLASGGGPGIATDVVDGQRIVVLWQPGVASALDDPTIAEGRDVGTSGVFFPQAAGRDLSFGVVEGRIVDRETASIWNVTGRATRGPLEGERLEPVIHLDSFWFAWQAYYPETLIHGLDSST